MENKGDKQLGYSIVRDNCKGWAAILHKLGKHVSILGRDPNPCFGMRNVERNDIGELFWCLNAIVLSVIAESLPIIVSNLYLLYWDEEHGASIRSENGSKHA